MILVDTSIWVDHFRRSDRKLVDLLNSGEVLAHPFVIGEIALGVLRDRETVIGLLRDLPAAKTATDDGDRNKLPNHRCPPQFHQPAWVNDQPHAGVMGWQTLRIRKSHDYLAASPGHTIIS